MILPLAEYHFFNETLRTGATADTAPFVTDRAGSLDLYAQGSPVIRTDAVLGLPVLYLENRIVSPKPEESSFTILKSRTAAAPRALKGKTVIVYVNPDMGATANANGQQDGGGWSARGAGLEVGSPHQAVNAVSVLCTA